MFDPFDITITHQDKRLSEDRVVFGHYNLLDCFRSQKDQDGLLDVSYYQPDTSCIYHTISDTIYLLSVSSGSSALYLLRIQVSTLYQAHQALLR